MSAATIPYPFPDLPVSRYDLVRATVLGRATYSLSVQDMLVALRRLGVDIATVRKPLAPSAPEGLWYVRATARWTRFGRPVDNPDSVDLHVDLTDPIGNNAAPGYATAVEDMAILAVLDLIIAPTYRDQF